jgi:lipopolysaccharide transport system ATP-binding protein
LDLPGFKKPEEGLPMSFDGNEIAIKLENVSKCFQIYDKPHHRLMQGLFRGRKQYFREFWALKDISFEIKKGETVGIIGRNGAGKSTLLQIICGTLTPTSGAVEINGRVAALLELGSGFNPEFTGRENVFMNGIILGMTQQEIETRLDDILAFADIGEFIDQPVKTYSSGMFVRLAFAVNIMAKPEIMIVDEALAVGDMNFQAKCMTALTRIQQEGATVLFVSHDVGAVKSLCSQGIYLEHGHMKASGKASEVAEQYVRLMREEMNAEHQKFVRVSPEFALEKNETTQSPEKSDEVLKRSDDFDKRVAAFRYGAGGVKITYVELLDTANEPIKLVEFNQKVKIRIYLESSSVQTITVNFNILDDKKVNLTGGSFLQAEQEFLITEIGGEYLVAYDLQLPLQEGNYSLRAQITAPVEGSAVFVDVIEDAVVFQVARWEIAKIWAKVHLFPTLTLTRLS